MLDLVWDMETEDPDDFLTLLWLCGCPDIRLKAVTINPGTPSPVGLVRRALAWFDLEVPVGSFDIWSSENAMSPWHRRAYGDIPPSLESEPAAALLLRHCDAHTTLLTGAPLHNLVSALRHPEFRLGRWVCQGGFAGEGVVPSNRQLPSFRGALTAPTYSLGASPREVDDALTDERIGTRRFVGKNVCHSVIYDAALHEHVMSRRSSSTALARIADGMAVYLTRRPRGKKLHDVLAA